MNKNDKDTLLKHLAFSSLVLGGLCTDMIL